MATTIDRIGRSGEFAVASQLALISDTVSLVPHNSYADIIFEYQRNLYKVQVKTSSKERNFMYLPVTVSCKREVTCQPLNWTRRSL